MKQEIDNNAMWAAFRQELALQGELQVVAAIDNALNNLGFTIEETSTIVPIPLKQGEHKPAWSEEDEAHIMAIDLAVNRCIGQWHCCGETCPISEHNPWLKSLKDRVQPQPKQEWSEEEIETCAREAEDNNCIILAKHIRQLKSLRPQSTWKPSDEQIKVLVEVLIFAANHESPHWQDYIFGILKNLTRQLKKLREE